MVSIPEELKAMGTLIVNQTFKWKKQQQYHTTTFCILLWYLFYSSTMYFVGSGWMLIRENPKIRADCYPVSAFGVNLRVRN